MTDQATAISDGRSELRALIAAAKNATPGPWQLREVGDGRKAWAPADAASISLLTVVEEGDADFAAVYEEADARFIALANPSTVAAMAEELLALREAVKAVLEHRVGDLPSRGDLRDNDASRQALANLSALAQEQT